MPCHEPVILSEDYSRISHVRIKDSIDLERIKEILNDDKNQHYVGQVNWILQQKEIKIYWKFSGFTQQRETSVWPIKAIETWPSSLRMALFGNQVDIQCAMPQFVFNEFKKIDEKHFGKLTIFTSKGFCDI